MPKRKTTTIAELCSHLTDIPAVAGIEQLRRLHNQFALIPSHAATSIQTELDRLAAVFEDNDLSVYDLVANQATVLQIATGIASNAVTRHQHSGPAETLHTTRNLLVAAAVAAVGSQPAIGTPAAITAIHAGSIKLARRSTLIRRPFTDDEILLARVDVYFLAQADPRDHTATVYALMDAGMVPGETTHFKIDDTDEPEVPRLLLAAGNHHLAARFLQADPITSHILANHIEAALAAGHSDQEPLTYKPRVRKDGSKHEPGSPSAVASAQRIIDRFIDRLRLPTTDITASSITQWRVATVLDSEGQDAALAVSGRCGKEEMYRALGKPAATKKAQTPQTRVTFALAT